MLELGNGWAPAVADDAAELNLIQEKERLSTDDRDYWIGGLAYDPVQNEGKFQIKLMFQQFNKVSMGFVHAAINNSL